MPNGIHPAAMLVLAVSVSAVPAPAWGQAGDLTGTNRLARPDLARPAPAPETYRDIYRREMYRAAPPSTAPRVANPSPGAGPPSGGILTERQARDRIVAAGLTSVGALRPSYLGSWTGYAFNGGSSVRVTVDAQGNVSVDY